MAVDTVIKLETDSDIVSHANGQVLNNKTINLKVKNRIGYYSNGLYDPVVFGSKNRCYCGKVSSIGSYCRSCRCKVMSESQFIRSYGYYKLNTPYIISLHINSFINKMKTYFTIGVPSKTLEDLWSIYIGIEPIDESEVETRNNIIKDKDGRYYSVIFTELPDDTNSEFGYSESYAGLIGLSQLGDFYTKDGHSLSWIDSYIHYVLLIPSPEIRPFSKFVLNGEPKVIESDLTTYYKAIIFYNQRIMLLMENMYKVLADKMTLAYMMNAMIDQLVAYNDLVQPSKESMGRNLIETRSTKSLRANIVSCMDLEMNQIYLPRTLAYKALQLDIVNAIKNEDIKRSNAIKMYLEKDPVAIQKFEEIVKNSMVTLVRNPSLHRFNMQAFYPILWDEIAIGIPIAVCESYNADFDGDSVAVQFYLGDYEKAKLQSITPDKLWFYDKKHTSLFNFKHETLYGLYVATKVTENPDGMQGFTSIQEIEDAYNTGKISVSEKIMYNDKVTTYGRAYIEEILGRDLEVILPLGQQFDCSNVHKLVSSIGYDADRVQKYKKLQDFGEKIATDEGMGAVPYFNLYKGSEEDIKEILSRPIQAPNKETELMERKKMLNDYIKKNIEDNIKNLPDSTIDDLAKSTGKVKIPTLANVYGPHISIQDGEITVDNADSLFNGLSERSYFESAEHDRQTLQLKQVIVPVSGYAQRQLVNAELNLVYHPGEMNPEPDTNGILLKMKDAIGRFRLDGSKVPTNSSEELVRVRSCVNTNTNIVYADEIAGEYVDGKFILGGKFSFPSKEDEKYPLIGVAFAGALTETATQAGLGFKHGGDLKMFSEDAVVALESGTVTDINGEFITIEGNNVYRYPITSVSILNKKLEVGYKVSEGEKIITSAKVIGADNNLVQFNTICDIQVAGDELGVQTTKAFSYVIDTCEIKYEDGMFKAGTLNHAINDNEIYYYPDGYKVPAGTRICSGIPDIAKYKKICSDTGLLYYIFFDYSNTQIPMFKGFNSEPFETLFKSIVNNKFSVKTVNMTKESFIDRLYYGGAKQAFDETLNKMEITQKDDGSDKSEVTIKLTDSVILPFIMRNKRYEKSNK